MDEIVWDGGPINSSGVYSKLDIERYHNDPSLFGDAFSISSSGMRALLRRPSEYWWSSCYNPDAHPRKSSAELEFGKLAHLLLLSEQGFAEKYVLQPKTCLNKKGEEINWSASADSAKAWLREQRDAGRSIIAQADLAHIRHMAAALAGKEAIRIGILNGRIERSIFTRRDGIWLKARPDVVPSDSGDFVDLKTAASVDDDSLARSIFTNGYHVQAGLLRLIVRDVLGAEAFSSFTFVFVEKTPPYDVRVLTLKDSDIDLGERQALHGLRILRDCLKRGVWPGFDGFDQHIAFTELPAWARTRIETQLNAEAA